MDPPRASEAERLRPSAFDPAPDPRRPNRPRNAPGHPLLVSVGAPVLLRNRERLSTTSLAVSLDAKDAGGRRYALSPGIRMTFFARSAPPIRSC